MGRFTDKTVVVTGAASGIGLACARRFAEQGARVAMFGHRNETLEKSAAQLRESTGAQIMTAAFDIADTEAATAAMGKVAGSFGAVNVLVNSAGMSSFGPLLDCDLATWDREQAVNCRAVLVMSQLAAKSMIDGEVEGGRIVSIASQSGKRGENHHGSYCVSKAGVVMMTQVLGLELAQYGITVNAICPGLVDTPMLRGAGAVMGLSDETFEQAMNSAIPLGKMADPSQIADAVEFLASPQGGYITGISLSIAGGTILY